MFFAILLPVHGTSKFKKGSIFVPQTPCLHLLILNTPLVIFNLLTFQQPWSLLSFSEQFLFVPYTKLWYHEFIYLIIHLQQYTSSGVCYSLVCVCS